MPTTEYRARRLLKKGRAVIWKHRPFTISITDRTEGEVQPVEYVSQVNYKETSVSVKSEKHNFLQLRARMLEDETERHHDQAEYRRSRRNRKRYREARFQNRRKPEGWLAPSIRHKTENQVRLFQRIKEVCPITEVHIEVAAYDTQALKAIQEGNPLPEGEDYQRGEQYRIATLREAVFTRDRHTCIFCGRGIKEKAILHMHHIGFWKGDRSDRLSNLGTCCERCHTPANHQPGGKLYGQEPKLRSMAGEAYMNSVRWRLFWTTKGMFPNVYLTYRAATKAALKKRGLSWSRENGTYCMGSFRPKHKTREIEIRKTRRNDRRLQKFYDAAYEDGRDGSRKKGKELFNGRISRNHKKDSENLHKYRGKKLQKGYVTIRRSRTRIKPGSLVEYNGEVLTVRGTHRSSYYSKKLGTVVKTERLEFKEPASNGRKTADIRNCTVIRPVFNTGWELIQQTS